MTDQKSNVSKYYRVPKHYISLPSGTNYYPEGFVDLNMVGQLPIRAMTTRDEMLLRNPEALINGESIIKVVQSCVPEVKDPKQLIAPDMELIITAIFSASYEDSMDTELECPVCKRTHPYNIPVEALLRSTPIEHEIPAKVTHEIKNSTNYVKFEFYVTPYTYEIVTLAGLGELEHMQLLKSLTDDNLDDEKKLKQYEESFNKMANYKYETVTKCVQKIVIMDTESDQEINLTTNEEIADFLFNTEKLVVDKITTKVEELNKSGLSNTFSVVCSNNECKHEWAAPIGFDESRFFGMRSR